MLVYGAGRGGCDKYGGEREHGEGWLAGTPHPNSQQSYRNKLIIFILEKKTYY
jgi:hypothetical protein